MFVKKDRNYYVLTLIRLKQFKIQPNFEPKSEIPYYVVNEILINSNFPNSQAGSGLCLSNRLKDIESSRRAQS